MTLDKLRGQRVDVDGGYMYAKVTEIAIGKRVVNSPCQLVFQTRIANSFIQLAWKNRSLAESSTAPTGNESNEKDVNMLLISPDEITTMKYFLADKSASDSCDEGAGSDSAASTITDIDSNAKGVNIIVLRVIPSEYNGLDQFSSAYLQSVDDLFESKQRLKKYIVILLENGNEFYAMLESMHKNPAWEKVVSECSQLKHTQVNQYLCAFERNDENKKKGLVITTPSGAKKCLDLASNDDGFSCHTDSIGFRSDEEKKNANHGSSSYRDKNPKQKRKRKQTTVQPKKKSQQRTNDTVCVDNISSSSASSDDVFDSSFTEDEVEHLEDKCQDDRAKVNAARIAIGKCVYSSGCQLSVHLISKGKTKVDKPYVRLSYRRDTKLKSHKILLDSILEMKYYLAENNEEIELDSSANAAASSESIISFLAMRVKPTEENGLDRYTRSYLQTLDGAHGDQIPLRKYIVVELRSDGEFETNMLEYMRKNRILGAFMAEDAQLKPRQAKKFTAALVKDDKKDIESRKASPKKRKADDEENKTILVYPFEAEQQVFDDACKDLTEVGGKVILGRSKDDGTNEWGDPPEEELSSSSSSAAALASAGAVASDDDPTASSAASAAPSGRTHYLTIRNNDMDRLEAGEFLNDTFIDFFMRWIWRKEDPDASSVHFFTSHFFSTLDDEGPASVYSWTAKKNIDIFTKRFVFIPINESLHWSLCVVVNPGHILNEYADEEDQSDDQDFPCILFLDSLKAHRKNHVARTVRKWLNCEAKRLNKFERNDPFNRITMEVFAPKIPYQDNSWDCGVFVCRYAYALYLMRDERLTYESAGTSEEPSLESPYFRNLITDSDEFNFGMSEIANLREEMKTLIQNLSMAYLEIKRKESVARKQKARRKNKDENSEGGEIQANNTNYYFPNEEEGPTIRDENDDDHDTSDHDFPPEPKRCKLKRRYEERHGQKPEPTTEQQVVPEAMPPPPAVGQVDRFLTSNIAPPTHRFSLQSAFQYQRAERQRAQAAAQGVTVAVATAAPTAAHAGAAPVAAAAAAASATPTASAACPLHTATLRSPAAYDDGLAVSNGHVLLNGDSSPSNRSDESYENNESDVVVEDV